MSESPKIYECGTLRYTLKTLIVTVMLIMLGFFVMGFMGSTVGIVSIRLKDLGASDFVLTLILSTVSQCFNITICPMVSFKSDRYRGKRWGRRIYYIITTMPMMVIAMLLLSCSGWIGGGLAPLFDYFVTNAKVTATITVIGLIMAMYHYFYMYVASVIYYIYNDVIPPQFLARVVGCVQITSTAASAFFSYFLFQYARSHFSQLLILGAIVYATGILVMSFYIKEPSYPPLTEEEQKQSNGFRGILTFMRESFSHKFYWYTFVGCACAAASTCIATFNVFFNQEMGLDLKKMGEMGGITGMVGVFASIAIAALFTVFVDRWHPMRFFTTLTIFNIVVLIVNAKWIFFKVTPESFYLICLVSGIIVFSSRMVGISGLPTLMRTYPKSRFGQFCSAQAMFRSLVTLVAGLILGISIDIARKLIGNGDYVYRLLPIWTGIWQVLSIIFYILAYNTWRKLGGEKDYKAPAPWSEEKYEIMENADYVPASIRKVTWVLRLCDVIMLAYAGFGFVYFNFINRAIADYYLLPMPCTIVLLVLWVIVRLFFANAIRRFRNGSSATCGIPHHGLLLMIAVQQALLLGLAVYEIFLVARENLKMSTQFWAFETCLAILSVIAIAAIGYTERGSVATK